MSRFIQMGFMVMGGSIEADRRIRLYEARVRMEKRLMRDQAVWEKYGGEGFEEPPASRKPSQNGDE